MDDSTATINEAIQLVEDRLASRVSIVFSHDFLQEFPTSAQAYFNEGRDRRMFDIDWMIMIYLEAMLDEQTDEDDEEDSSSSSSISTENRPQNEQRQHRCIKQMGKLTKVNEWIDFVLILMI
jgi:hypothetical protein